MVEQEQHRSLLHYHQIQQARELAKRAADKAKYVAKEVGHTATHDMARASAKVWVKQEDGQVVQKLKSETTDYERKHIVARNRTISSPIPPKSQTNREYANPFDLYFGRSPLQSNAKMYYPAVKRAKRGKKKKKIQQQEPCDYGFGGYAFPGI